MNLVFVGENRRTVKLASMLEIELRIRTAFADIYNRRNRQNCCSIGARMGQGEDIQLGNIPDNF